MQAAVEEPTAGVRSSGSTIAARRPHRIFFMFTSKKNPRTA
jgi:hypothetical protein